MILVPFIITWLMIPLWIVGQVQMMMYHIKMDTEHRMIKTDKEE